MNLINIFANHKLARNLTMLVMALSGIWAMTSLNVGLNPPQMSHVINTSISWRGASAEDEAMGSE